MFSGWIRRDPRRIGLGVLITVLAAGGCNYGFRSGSFPDHIRTVAILPFENDTSEGIHTPMLREAAFPA